MMFEKGKRARQRSEEDKVFNRMLLWLAGAVAAELLLLLLKKVFVEMIWGGAPAMGLLNFFNVFTIAGLVLAVGCAVWAAMSLRAGKPLVLPLSIGGAAAGLWVISMLCRFLGGEGMRVALMLPPAVAVLIVIYFLYQRPFFYNAVLNGGGMLAVWLYEKHYMYHPRMILACFIAGWVALAAAAVLALKLRGSDGKLGKLRVLPVQSNYLMTFLTCVVTAAAMVLAMILGASACRYLLYVLVGWLFAQAVFFTVKMM